MNFVEQIENWFKLKIRLWAKEDRVVFKQGEIWWCSLGFNLGEKIFGILRSLKIVIPPCGGNQWVTPNLFHYSKPENYVKYKKSG